MADSITRRLIRDEAERRGWQTEEIGRNAIFFHVTDDNGRSELFVGSRPLKSSANGLMICNQKDLTMQYVESKGYKVPAYTMVDSFNAEAREFLQAHKTIVAKPIDGQQSLGVTANITSEEQLSGAIDTALGNSRWGKVLLQAQLSGKLYRLFAINGKLAAAAHRKAAEVIGDGQRTVKEHIERLNEDPRRSDGMTTPLKKVRLADAEVYLGEEILNSIPQQGQAVRVGALESISAGGEATNVTDQVHPDWQKAITDITVPASLFVCGFDVMSEDISQPLSDNYLPLLELNSAPGLKLHHFPTGGGEPVDLAALLLDEVFSIAKN